MLSMLRCPRIPQYWTRDWTVGLDSWKVALVISKLNIDIDLPKSGVDGIAKNTQQKPTF